MLPKAFSEVTHPLVYHPVLVWNTHLFYPAYYCPVIADAVLSFSVPAVTSLYEIVLSNGASIHMYFNRLALNLNIPISPEVYNVQIFKELSVFGS